MPARRLSLLPRRAPVPRPRVPARARLRTAGAAPRRASAWCASAKARPAARARAHARALRCQTVRAELREAELRQEHGEQDEVAAVLHDLSRVSRQLHCCRRSVAKECRHHSGHDDLRLQPRIGLGLDERLLEESLRSLEVVTRALSEPPQHASAFSTRRQLLDERLEDRTRPLRVPARVVMVGREQLPAAQDAPRRPSAGVSESESSASSAAAPDAPREAAISRSGLQLVGDPGRRPVSRPERGAGRAARDRRRAPRDGDGAIAAAEGRAPTRPARPAADG